jgi:hypothetical protein
MTKKDEKRQQIKEYEKLTKIVKEAFRSAAEYTKKDMHSPSGINFRSC